MAGEILFVGDIHLGRRPRRLPDDLAEHGISPGELTPAAAFANVVRYAVDAGVAAVVLAGDVVQSDNARFEAYGQLQRGVTTLTRHGIAVYAVAGNHDVEALPRLADAIDGFELVGRGGRWEERIVRAGGRPVARLLGWSFARAEQTSSPLAQSDMPRFAAADGLPRLGVLHCDLLSSASRHAPVTVGELERAPVDGWLLGHVHQPSALGGARPIGYLGSLVGLDPSETGRHGPWLLRIGDDATIAVEPLSLGPLRWESLDVPVDGLDDADAIECAIREAMTAAAAGDQTRVLGCRIRLTGATRRIDAARRIESGGIERLRLQHGSVLCFVERLINAARPEIDLQSLAVQDDPPGILATKLLALERGDDEARSLIQRARRELQRSLDDRRWLRLPATPPDDDALRALLIDAGRLALGELLGQSAERRR
ncbi:MAG TPA: metallophosphoesterase [Candidatus Polarisedimenticolaceae bacterium]|nr:metallophosphoesterase [Candidatus Polarisedimenticolaceae bacterium]